jgi:hypothetical protein
MVLSMKSTPIVAPWPGGNMPWVARQDIYFDETLPITQSSHHMPFIKSKNSKQSRQCVDTTQATETNGQRAHFEELTDETCLPDVCVPNQDELEIIIMRGICFHRGAVFFPVN